MARLNPIATWPPPEAIMQIQSPEILISVSMLVVGAGRMVALLEERRR